MTVVKYSEYDEQLFVSLLLSIFLTKEGHDLFVFSVVNTAILTLRGITQLAWLFRRPDACWSVGYFVTGQTSAVFVEHGTSPLQLMRTRADF